MIIEQETSRYNVDTYKAIEGSFSGAYDSVSDAPVVLKPDLVVTISGCFSMVLLAGMCALTYIKENSILWLVVGIACLMSIAYIVFKHNKNDKLYKKNNTKGSQKFDYNAEYISLFPKDLPEKMTATDLTREIAPMQNKQTKVVYNNAIRGLVSKLNAINNPQDILCKNVNSYGELMAQPRKRYYFKAENDKFIAYDADFMNPRGELVIDAADVISYGPSPEYDLAKYLKNGGKVSNYGIIIEIKTGLEDNLYLEAMQNDLDKIKKVLGKRTK